MVNVSAHRRVREVKPGDTIRLIKDLSSCKGQLAGQNLRLGQTLVVESLFFVGSPICIGLRNGTAPAPLCPNEFEVIVYK